MTPMQRHDGTSSSATAGGLQFDTPALRPQVSNWRPSSYCQTTSPMRHCKIDSFKHDSQR
ncbi:unnamed protein product [Staurois parvus]|uniref:Uncharacterized protein n=1 Tax=Staurois parvus TaxID=386267 RepID=A0ABN9DSA9_9NEOB|nr:unnamed protein product [Staurois parvus]